MTFMGSLSQKQFHASNSIQVPGKAEFRPKLLSNCNSSCLEPQYLFPPRRHPNCFQTAIPKLSINTRFLPSNYNFYRLER